MTNLLGQKKRGQAVHSGNFFVTGTLMGLLLSGLVVPSAFAQQSDDRDVIALQNQVAQLKAEVNQLQAQSLSSDSDSGKRRKRKRDDNGDATPNTGLLPDLLTRVNTLEDQQRTMRGELDDLNNQVQSKIDLLNKKIDDMNFAAGHGNNVSDSSSDKMGGTPAAEPAKPAGKTLGVSNVTANTGTGSTLKDGQQALLGGDFVQSAAIARKIIATPEGKKSVSAYFLLAQSLAGQGNYKESALNYYNIYKNFPASAKAPEALLGVGYSLIKNGEKKAACQALGLLRKKYPNSSDRIRTSAAALGKKASCS